jgi:hypothetical protein
VAVLLLVAGVALLAYRRSRRSRRQASTATVEGVDGAATSSQLVATTADGAVVGSTGVKGLSSTKAKANAAAKATRAPSQRYLLRSPSRATVFPDEDATGLVAADDAPHATAARAEIAAGAAASLPVSGSPEIAENPPGTGTANVPVTAPPDPVVPSPTGSAFVLTPSSTDTNTAVPGAALHASAAERHPGSRSPSLPAAAAPGPDVAAELAAAERSRLPGEASTAAADPQASHVPDSSAAAPSASPARDASSVPRRAASIKLMRAAVTAASATAYVATASRSRAGPRVASGWSQRNLLLEESRGSSGGGATARGEDGVPKDGLLVRDVSAADVLSLATARGPLAAPSGSDSGGRAAGPAATCLAAIDEGGGAAARGASSALVTPPTMRAAAGLSSAAAATLVSSRLPVALASPRDTGSLLGRDPEEADLAPRQAPSARLQSYERQPSMRAMVVGSPQGPTLLTGAALLRDTPGTAGAGGAVSVSARPEGVERRSTFRRKPSLTRLIAPPGDHVSTGGRS